MPLLSQGGCIKDIFVTDEEMIELFTGKQLWLWGSGAYGRLGTNSVTNQSSPVQTVSGGTNWRSASLGNYHSAAIKTDGSLWSWGAGLRLGDNSTTARSSPVQTVSGGTNWRSVSLGNNHSAAIKTDGSLWLWGVGNIGQIGNNSTATFQSSPVQTVSGGTNWRSVSLGINLSAAIKTDGSLWLWGCNTTGQIGNNSAASQSSPVQTVSGGTNWRSVSLGGHSAAIKTDGSLWMWGTGTSGQLGDNSNASQSSPVQTVSGGTNWRSVSLGNYHSAAIKTDGSLWLWGFGSTGILGNNSTTRQSSPVQTVSGGTNWRSASLGKCHSAATKIIEL